MTKDIPPFDVEAARTILKDAIWKAIDPSVEGVARHAYEQAIKALTDNLPAALAAGAARVVAERDKMKVAWQPIETAKKDGTWLLLAKIVGHPDHPTSLWWACRGHWSSKWNNWNDGVEPCGLAGPTHWLVADGHGVSATLTPKEPQP